MDADGAGHLREAADRLLDVAGRHHHQVGELVDHDEDERQPVVRGDALGVVTEQLGLGSVSSPRSKAAL